MKKALKDRSRIRRGTMARRYVDVVSKAEVLETYAELYDVFDDYKGIQKELHKVYDKLNALPTADVVEVVRCKNCKHSIEDKLFGGLWCQHPTEKHCERNDDFYCGSGERREDEKSTKRTD